METKQLESRLVQLTEVPENGKAVGRAKTVLGKIDSSFTPCRFIVNEQSLMEKLPETANAYFVGDMEFFTHYKQIAAVQFYQILVKRLEENE